jgi:flagellar basal-body rod protein FlgF
MYKGIYVAMTGSNLKMMELDNTANNLANVSTNGYKRTSFASRLYPLMEGLSQNQTAIHADARAMAVIGKSSIDSSQGMAQTTGNPLDVAIVGEGFFVVDVKGQQNFTRNGSFSIDKDGFLATSSGYRVIGIDNKPISLGKEIKSRPTIALDGTITVDGNTVGQIKTVKVTDIKPVSESLFSGKGGETLQADMRQGFVERSNVNPMREMIAMITAQREFQTLQQMIRSFDQLSSEAITQIARV